MLLSKNTKKFLSKLLIVGLTFSQVTVSLAASFKDVPETSPDYKAIEFLKTEGIIKGYEDGTFRPNQSVNRAEALKMIFYAKKLEGQSFKLSNFKDVAVNDWFFQIVETAYNLKIVSGNPDGTFAPKREVSKVEFLKMLLLTFEVVFKNYQAPTKALYTDTPDGSQWFIPYLDFSKNINIITPTAAGNIEPAKPLNRAEVAQIIYKLLVILKGGPVQLLLSRAEANLIQSIFDLQKGDTDAAQVAIKSARTLADQALEQMPKESIVQAASKIIEAFQSLVEAFKTSKAKDYTAALKLSGEAFNKAEEARKLNSAVENLATQVKAIAKTLADSIRAEQK